MQTASFEVDIGPGAAREFASLSGDWNPLHTDEGYAAGTRFRRPILHGAYLSGLVSRMAGMHIPGTACLLHSIRLKFNAPVQPPVRVLVKGTTTSDDGVNGRVEVTIEDVESGTLFAGASYDFSRHQHTEVGATEASPSPEVDEDASARILVTGASGALGSAVVEVLGGRALGTSRGAAPGLVHVPDFDQVSEGVLPSRIDGIVHCGWPSPDNQRLLELANTGSALEHHVSSPVRQSIALARLLAERGTAGACLVLVGSTAAQPGRHNYRMPLYTLSKSLVPGLARILALELAPLDRRCVAITFDVIDGGMNEELSPRARVMNADRSPFGKIPTPAEAAEQVAWVLDNRGFLASGATLDLTGGAMP